MSRLIDLDQTIFVPIIDESKGGVSYEMQMTVGEMFDKFCEGFQPKVVDAMPVEWLKERKHWAAIDGDHWAENIIRNLLDAWQKEQEAQK